MSDCFDCGERLGSTPTSRPAGRRAWPWLIAAALAASGCSDSGDGPGEGVAVTGRVSFDGKPVEQGTVAMIPVGDGGEPVSAEIKDGVFKTTRRDGPRPGKHRVEIRAFAALSGAESAKAKAKAQAAVNTVMFGKDPSAYSAAAEIATPRVNVVPERYNSRSELTTDVPSGESYEVAFDLVK